MLSNASREHNYLTMLTSYPLNLPGRLYGSAMPFGLYDPDGTLLPKFRAASIHVVVLLAEPDECREKTGRDLLGMYQEEGLTVLSLPIPNYGIPVDGGLSEVVKRAHEHVAQGQNLLIHCSAGLGRTALFATLLARSVLGLSGPEALAWLGRHQPGALLTPAQIMLIME
ncbi:MAG: hypothetical protein ABS70_01375 [Nitrospira sp. SCN 59-13]|nr:MAG: hypothetical protein ABS70_01375 [Nitrospira sp. SCN 59-13]